MKRFGKKLSILLLALGAIVNLANAMNEPARKRVRLDKEAAGAAVGQGSEIDTLIQEPMRGDAGAQTLLGFRYLCGNGLEKNEQEAVRLFTLAANQGYDKGQSALGHCFLHGIGVLRRDDKRAVRLLRAAAANDEATAQTALGFCHLTGREVEKNRDEAKKLFKLAAEKGYPPAVRIYRDMVQGMVVLDRQEAVARLETLVTSDQRVARAAGRGALQMLREIEAERGAEAQGAREIQEIFAGSGARAIENLARVVGADRGARNPGSASAGGGSSEPRGLVLSSI